MSEIDAYDYELPKELIAQEPLSHRADARLMVIDRQRATIDHHHIRDLPQMLHSGDCLVLNDTQVIPARLAGRRERTGAKWSGLFLQEHMQGVWQILSKTRGRLEPGEFIVLEANEGGGLHRLQLVSKQEGGTWLAVPSPAVPAIELLNRVGRVPLPPYIRAGQMHSADRQSYQTVFAQHPGSVAAPTAGLHFTPELLQKLSAAGIDQAKVTLHVGIGTFRPIAVNSLREHVMHSEWCQINQATCEQLQRTHSQGSRVIAVGTTALRTLESASISGKLQPYAGQTDLFVRPGFTFHTVNALLTNFHLPRSSLLVLVQTFGGHALLQRAYEEAIRERYRFFSYGDAMLIV